MQAQPFLERNMHPRNIVFAYTKALEFCLEELNKLAVKLDVNNREGLCSLL